MLFPSRMLITAVLLTWYSGSVCGTDAPTESCTEGNCAHPSEIIDTLYTQLMETFGDGPAKHGDGVCNISRGETCMTSPADCGGPCKPLKPVMQCRNPKHFALTFDDGPSSYIRYVLEILKHHKIKATFFVNGNRIVNNQADVKLIHDSGHIIGSQTYSHKSLLSGPSSSDSAFSTFEYKGMLGELLVNDLAIANMIGKYPLFVRPPYLENTDSSLAFMQTVGYTPVSMNVDMRDPSYDPFKQGVGESSWVMLQNDHSIDSLSQTLRTLKRRKDIEFVSLDECLDVPAYRADTDSPFLSKDVKDRVVSDEVNVASSLGMPDPGRMGSLTMEMPPTKVEKLHNQVPRVPKQVAESPAVPTDAAENKPTLQVPTVDAAQQQESPTRTVKLNHDKDQHVHNGASDGALMVSLWTGLGLTVLAIVSLSY